MKYPYIAKGLNSGSIVLFYEQNKGITLELKTWASENLQHSNCINEDLFKNITEECLANTYGEVKSKEHAEFIVKLAEANGIVVFKDSEATRPKDIKYFSVTCGGILYFWSDKATIRCDRKQITIPLPPERESVDEWPKVGDDAVVINKNDYTLIYGHEVVGENVKVLTTYSTSDISMAVVEFDGCGYCFRVDMLEKPKTPEQELAEKLIEKYKHLGKKDQAIAIARDIVQNSIDKYNITKKPQ